MDDLITRLRRRAHAYEWGERHNAVPIPTSGLIDELRDAADTIERYRAAAYRVVGYQAMLREVVDAIAALREEPTDGK